MKTLSDYADQLALNKLTDIELIRLREDGQGLVHIGVQLRAYVFALEAHRSSRRSEVIEEPLHGADAGISHFPARDLHDGEVRQPGVTGDARP